ncbi:LPS export ABC transporter permease LptF [Marinomonas sp. MED121]|uniref:LPS export ABC transporter permease LptF n=1 Tax=Marinomonas sp. MED121 TaxID=314277 RepID=UPI00055DB63F|nr:LPS export ABC transporter permease LptF [Marinomonas sp. MED121]
MKLFRYLAKEVLVSTMAVSFILLLIIASGRFVSYLGRAAEGKMTFEFLFIILGFHIPSFLQIIIPLSFFLALLLAYGRLYIENEMSILFACGISKVKLTFYTLGIALIATLVNASISLWLAPTSEYQSQLAKAEQDQLTVFDFLQPGRFQGKGFNTTYVAEITPEEGWMKDVFISNTSKVEGKNIPTQTLASHAEQIQLEGGDTYLVFKNGTRFEGVPGQLDYRITQFDTYAVLLDEKGELSIEDPSTKPSSEIWRSDDLNEQAEWQWRISLVIMIPILAIIGTSLSQVNPRQGRFFKMLPAILLMILYLGLLIWGRTSLEKGRIPSSFGLWWVHILFGLIAAFLFSLFNEIRLIKKPIKADKQSTSTSDGQPS